MHDRCSIRIRPPKPQKPRRRTTRCKTGCLTCRKRRVKCDETGPPCKKCIALGLKCQSIAGPSILDLEKSSAVFHLSDPQSGLDWRFAPVNVETGRQEVRIFDLFRRDLVNRIGGPIDKAFWTYEILQAAQVHPPIWHSCLALAAAFEHSGHFGQMSTLAASSASGSASAKHHNSIFILKQYSTSLLHLRKLSEYGPSLTHSQQESLLISCILLASLCALRLNAEESLLHAQHAVQIYHGWNFRSRTILNTQSSRGTIRSHFINGMISCFELLLFYKIKDPCDSIWQSYFDIPPCSELAFSSSTEAFYELQPLLTGFQNAMLSSSYPDQHRLPCSMFQTLQSYYGELGRWKRKFQAFKSCPYYQPESPDTVILRMHAVAVDIIARLCHTTADMDDARYIPQYTAMVDLMERALENDYASSRKGVLPGPMLSYSSGLSYLVAIPTPRCPKRSIHKRVIDLMLAYERQDGIWRSKTIGTIRKAIFDFETAAMNAAALQTVNPCACKPPDYICALHRVVFNSLMGHKGDSMIIRLLTQNDVQQGCQGKEILVPFV